MRRFFTKKSALIASIVVLLAGAGIGIARSGRSIKVAVGVDVVPQATEAPQSPLTGTQCDGAARRPLAVMLTSDPEARPLSGIAEADLVIEMPVTEGGVTRMMAVYQCGQPAEYGSIRSARRDFIPLVQGLDALYLHWGGEHDALAMLDRGVTDNIDCLKLDGTTCRRKSSIPRPHNGYSTPALVGDRATVLGYDLGRPAVSYPHDKESRSAGELEPPALYEGDFAVRWTYDPASNRYLRSRGGRPETDRSSGAHVMAVNVVILRTTSQYVNMLYNRVKTVGTGSATIYKNGQAINAVWRKSTDTSKLAFFDDQGREIPFAPGNVWIEIVTQ